MYKQEGDTVTWYSSGCFLLPIAAHKTVWDQEIADCALGLLRHTLTQGSKYWAAHTQWYVVQKKTYLSAYITTCSKV